MPLILFSVIFILFNLDGKIIDNDTIEYIKFAQDFANGNFPTSAFYQPGVGFLVFIVSKLFFCNLLSAFSIVNFASGLGLIWILSCIWSMESNRQGLKLYVATLPVILYLSSLLYADIVFDFQTFFGLLPSLALVSNGKLAPWTTLISKSLRTRQHMYFKFKVETRRDLKLGLGTYLLALANGVIA